MASLGNHIRMLVYRDQDIWVAQGLEADISVQAGDLHTLQDRFERACELETRLRLEQYDDPFYGLSPAPREFFELWEATEFSLEPNVSPAGCKKSIRIAA